MFLGSAAYKSKFVIWINKISITGALSNTTNNVFWTNKHKILVRSYKTMVRTRNKLAYLLILLETYALEVRNVELLYCMFVDYAYKARNHTKYIIFLLTRGTNLQHTTELLG